MKVQQEVFKAQCASSDADSIEVINYHDGSTTPVSVLINMGSGAVADILLSPKDVKELRKVLSTKKRSLS